MDRPSLRQDIDTLLKERNNPCQDIRAREVKGQGDLTDQAELMVRTYLGSGQPEHFIR